MIIRVTNVLAQPLALPGVGTVKANGTDAFLVTEDVFRLARSELDRAVSRLGASYTVEADPVETVITNASVTDVPFDPAGTGLTATSVTDAVKELDEREVTDIPFDPVDTGLVATSVVNAIKELDARPSGGGFTPTVLTITTGVIAEQAAEAVTITPEFTTGVILGARLTKLAGTSTSARVSVTQQPGLTQGEIDVISSGMDTEANLDPGPAYGPAAREMGIISAAAFFVKTMSGDLTFTFNNRAFGEGETITLELEVLVLPLSFS